MGVWASIPRLFYKWVNTLPTDRSCSNNYFRIDIYAYVLVATSHLKNGIAHFNQDWIDRTVKQLCF